MRGTMTEKDKKRENKAETMAVRAALLVEELQRKRPLVHCITNYVTANDCANILLAIGASPIMADDPEETGRSLRPHLPLSLIWVRLPGESWRPWSGPGRAPMKRGFL